MAEEQNRATAEWLMRDVWSKGDLSGGEARVQPVVIGHNRGQSVPADHAMLAQMVANWRTAFPDLQHAIEAVIAERDQVAMRVPFSGTHTGTFRVGAISVPPTGKRVNVNEMVFLRFEDGKIAEVWNEFDLLGLLQQLDHLGARPVQAAVSSA